MSRVPDVPKDTRLLGFIRPDDTKRIAVIFLGAIPMVLGAVIVGYGFGRLEVIDPAGLHHDAREYAHSHSEGIVAPADAAHGDAPVGSPWFLFLAGLALVASGPILAFVVLGRIWRRDEWILIRDDALVMQFADGDTTLRWDAMDRIFYDPNLNLVALTFLEGEDMALPRRFDCGDAKDTAIRLDAIRRKASFGLL
ncbi:MAG: hypothetical protein ACI9KE_004077 [Polyangiales bacterium]|jgi:hypothetical protein